MEHIGLISTVVCWGALIFMIRNWKGDSSMTFSQHAAQHKSSTIYYAVLWVIILPQLLWFLLWPLSDALNMGITFKATVLMAGFFMLVAALVPEIEGWKLKVHRFSAFSMASLMVPSLLLILFSEYIPITARMVVFCSLAFMLWSIVFVWFNTAIKHNRRQHSKTLILQASYIACFHLSVLAAFYL